MKFFTLTDPVCVLHLDDFACIDSLLVHGNPG
jgi:hypothetical protein